MRDKAMAHLRGSSEAAEQLQLEIYNSAEALKDLATAQSRSLAALSESCHDSSYETMEYIVRQSILYIQNILPDLAEVCKRLQAYRDLIDALESPAFGAVSSTVEAKGYDKATQVKWIRSYQGATVKQVGQQWSNGLHREQKSAVWAYTGSAYSDINATLRGLTNGFLSEDNRNCALQIHSALDKSRIPCDCVVYRGMSAAALGSLEKLTDRELVGKVYTDNGFMSTSLSCEDAFRGAVLLEIAVPKGAKGAYVGYISHHGHSESEVLFDMGQYLQIQEVKRDRYGKRIICARMMPVFEVQNG